MNRAGRIFFSSLLIAFSISASFSQQTVLYADPETDYTGMLKEYQQGLYGKAAQSAERFLNTYHETEFQSLREEAEFIRLRSWLRIDRPGAIESILAFAHRHQPSGVAHRALMLAGEVAYEHFEYEKSIEYLTKVDARKIPSEDRSSLHFKLGYSLFVLKNFEQAAFYFSQTSEVRDKFYYPANYYYGMSQYFLGHYNEVIRSFERVAPSEYYKDFIPYYITQIHFNNGQYHDVIGYGNHALESLTVQNKTEIRHLIGQAYFETGDYQSALPHLEYVEQNTEKLRTDDFYQLGMAYYHAQRYEDAIRVLLNIRNERGAKAHYANYYLGQAYLYTGDRTSARNSLRNAMNMEDVPSIATESKFHYGRLSAEAGDDVEAIRILQTIPASSPDYDDAQNTLAGILINTNDYALAIRELEAMSSLTKKLQEAYQKVTLYRAEQFIQENEVTEALALLNKTLKYPVNKNIQARAIFWLGEIAHHEGKHQESIKWYNQYFSLADHIDEIPVQQSLPVAYYNQGYNYLGIADYTEALRNFEQSVDGSEKVPGNVPGASFIKNQILADALLRAGDCAFKRSLYDKAIGFYDRSINKQLAGADYAVYQKGIIRGLQNKTSEKIQILESLVASQPKSLWADDALYQLGNTYQDENQKNKAINSYERLVRDYKQSSPLLQPAILKLGLLSYNSGQFEEALKYYKSIFQYNPDPETSKEAISAIQEIYVNELDKPEAFFEFAGTVPGYTVTGAERDSILYNAAENQYAQGEYIKAAESFQRYLDQNPKGAYALKAKYLRAESLSLSKNWDAALSAYESVIKEGQSTYLTSSLLKAALIAYNQKQDMARAYRYYMDYVPLAESDDKQFEALTGALRSAYRLKNAKDVTELAGQISTHVRATDDIRALAFYYSGVLSMEAGNWDQAIAAFNQVIKLNSAELAAESRYQIAAIYQKKGLGELAGKLAEEAARANVGYPVWVAKPLLLLSDIHFDQGDLLNARAIIEAIIENFKGDSGILDEANQRLIRIQKAEEEQSRIKPASRDTLELQTNPKRE